MMPLEQGGEVLAGGIVSTGRGSSSSRRWCAPGRMPVVQEEIFAPILYLMEYDDLEQAIAWHNDVPQGLSSAIFTSNLFAGRDVPQRARQRLRHREREHRHERRGDRRRLRRREGDRRRPRGRQRRLESLHAAPDCHHQLVEASMKILVF